MIVYADTSALVPLLIEEPGSAACRELWDAADRVLVTRLAYVEVSAALARAQRLHRLDPGQLRQALEGLDILWPAVSVIELDRDLMVRAALIARSHALRGFDSVHCAAAISVNDVQVVAASGDGKLLAAWQAEGVMVCDMNA